MKPQETAYITWRGVLRRTPVSSTRRRRRPVLAPLLAACSAGWFVLGGWLFSVDTHSWDVIIPSALVGSGFYLLLARWAYRDWQGSAHETARPQTRTGGKAS